jgi:capsular polysaccharide biosynthesis protein
MEKKEMNPIEYAPTHYYEEDEIDLLDLIKVLYKRKKMILIISLIVFLGGIVSLFFIKSEYKSEFSLTINKNQKQTLNFLGELEVNVNVIFNKNEFQKEILTKELKDYYIENINKNYEELEVIDWLLNKVLTIEYDNKMGVYNISVVLDNQKLNYNIALNLYNNFNEYINEKIIKNRIEENLKILNIKIESLVEEYNNINKNIQERKKEIENLYLKYNEGKISDYQIGYETENAKKEYELNIGLLNDVNKEILELKKEKINYNNIGNVNLVELIKEPIYPKTPFKPNKKLILLISLVLGMFLGVFAAFFIEFVSNVDWEEIERV